MDSLRDLEFKMRTSLELYFISQYDKTKTRSIQTRVSFVCRNHPETRARATRAPGAGRAREK